jgi:hypothetical protein
MSANTNTPAATDHGKPNGPKPPFTIFVNSREESVNNERVTFEQVVQIAFPEPHGPNIEFSMTYRQASSKPSSGELGPGGSVEVKKHGTIFNVTKTDKS